MHLLCKAIEMPSANKEGIISLMWRDFLSFACCAWEKVMKQLKVKSEINVFIIEIVKYLVCILTVYMSEEFTVN